MDQLCNGLMTIIKPMLDQRRSVLVHVSMNALVFLNILKINQPLSGLMTNLLLIGGQQRDGLMTSIDLVCNGLHMRMKVDKQPCANVKDPGLWTTVGALDSLAGHSLMSTKAIDQKFL